MRQTSLPRRQVTVTRHPARPRTDQQTSAFSACLSVGKEVEHVEGMRRGLPLLLLGAIGIPVMLTAQDARPTFKARVERVTLSATVRTGRGRAVTNLQPSDFQLYDSGQL